MQRTHNINIKSIRPLSSPKDILAEFPISDGVADHVVSHREKVCRILSGEDSRLLVVVGPCSIHDPASCLEYAGRLKELSAKVADRMQLVMRVYFEKPRTTVGWKGLINDPHLNDTFDIETGLRRARKLLLEVNELGVPAATEMLEPITPQYIADLLTLASIGREQRNRRRIGRWPAGCRCRSALRTGPTANFKSRSTRCRRHATHTLLLVSTNKGTPASCKRWGILGDT